MSDEMKGGHKLEPAFPINGGIHENQYNGMTLRDYMAIHAPSNEIKHYLSDGLMPDFGKARYKYADAMLEARKCS